MAYDPLIPQGTDRIRVSAPAIQENFFEISTVFGNNHATLNAADAGKHIFLQLVAQPGDPGTGAAEGALYTKAGNFSGLVELFFQRQNNGAVLNLTQSLANPDNVSPGYCYVGPVLIKWGESSAADPAAGVYNVDFPVAGNIPVFATVTIVFTQQIGGVIQQFFIMSGVPTTVGFPITKVNTGAPYFVPFLAIGT